MLKALVSLLIMCIAAFLGLFLGAALGNPVGGMILTALIAGISCIVYAIDGLKKDK